MATVKPTEPVDLTCAQIVGQMAKNSEAQTFASGAGLNISKVSWEDNARTKNSSWGPCISDMTLQAEGTYMPLIKNTTNFIDETWDVEIEKIPLVVGNQDDSTLKTITLKDYLGDLRSYLHAPKSWPGPSKSLLASDKDKHVICSAQACFLPISASGEAEFNVGIFSYQSRASDPAVLAIVASVNGTSAQVLDSRSVIKLYHNKNGRRASFVAQRLSDYRSETGSPLPDASPMTSSEKSQNMLLIIQVPLKRKTADVFEPPKPHVVYSRSPAQTGRADVESAIVKVGNKDYGPFTEINGIEIERDDRYPIRVTMQYYKATSNGVVDTSVMTSIADDLQGARKWAVAISSLVTETTNRTTEHSKGLPVQKPTSALELLSIATADLGNAVGLSVSAFSAGE